jgi:hypothetical protein
LFVEVSGEEVIVAATVGSNVVDHIRELRHRIGSVLGGVVADGLVADAILLVVDG